MTTHEPTTVTATHEADRCQARTTSGRPCRAHPIRGARVCRVHGGSAPQVRRAAERRLEADTVRIEAARLMDLEGEDLHPVEHLLHELHRSAALVRVLGGRLGEVDIVTDRGAHPLWRVWTEERDRRAQLASLALRAGAEERRVRIAEEQGTQVAEVIVASLTDLGVDPDDPNVRQVIAGHLRSASTGKDD